MSDIEIKFEYMPEQINKWYGTSQKVAGTYSIEEKYAMQRPDGSVAKWYGTMEAASQYSAEDSRTEPDSSIKKLYDVGFKDDDWHSVSIEETLDAAKQAVCEDANRRML